MKVLINSHLAIIMLGFCYLFVSLKSQDNETKAISKNSLSPNSIWATEWSNDDKYIAVGGDDNFLWIYNANNYSLFKKIDLKYPIKNLSWHPQENMLAIATTKGVHLLDMKSEIVTTISSLKTGGRAVGWNHDGTLLALADGLGVVQIMDKTGKYIRSIKKHNNNSYVTMDWHPSKNIIVTGSDEIILFDTSGKQLAFIKHRPENTLLLTARWHPSGEFFVTGDYGYENEGRPTLLQYWRPNGTMIREIKGHHKEIRNLKWNRDGSLLATASDGLRIWNKQGQLLYQSPMEAVLWGLSWNKTNDKIVTGTFENGDLRIWTAEAQVVKEF